MEIFYCRECGKWFDYEDGAYYPVEREATFIDPKEYADTEICTKCGAPVEVDCIVDDVVEFLNKIEAKPLKK